MISPEPKPKGRSLSWFQSVARVLANPSIASFDALLADPRASLWRAIRWLFLSITLGWFAFFLILQVVSGSINPAGLPTTLVFCIITAVHFTFSVAFFAGCISAVSRMMDGSGTFEETVYTFAAFIPALYFIEFPLFFLTDQPIFFVMLRLYRVVLIGLAVRAVHRLPWWKTGLAMIVGGVVSIYLGGSVFLF